MGYAAGPFSTALTGERVNAPMSLASQSRTTAYHLSVGWQINNAFAFKGGARHFKQEPAAGGADLRANTYWADVNWQATPALGVTAALYFQYQRNVAAEADPKMLVLRAKYELSKHTDLYVATAHARARDGQPAGLTRDVSPQGITASVTRRPAS